MYKYYYKNNYWVMEYVFYSLTDYIDYLENTPVNYSGFGTHFLQSVDGYYSFCQTSSLDKLRSYVNLDITKTLIN